MDDWYAFVGDKCPICSTEIVFAYLPSKEKVFGCGSITRDNRLIKACRPGLDVPAIVSADPNIMGGIPVVGGTSFPISLILQSLAHGESIDEFLLDYTDVHRTDLVAVLYWLSHYVNNYLSTKLPENYVQ